MSSRQAFQRGSYAAGSSSSTRWPMHQVITRPGPSSASACRAHAQHAREIARNGRLLGDHELHAGASLLALSGRGRARCLVAGLTGRRRWAPVARPSKTGRIQTKLAQPSPDQRALAAKLAGHIRDVALVSIEQRRQVIGRRA